MDNFIFSLAKDNEIHEILDVYHHIIGTPGCTWNLDYPNKEDVESDIRRGSLYVLKENTRIIAVAAAGPDQELEHLQWSLQKPCDLARIGVIPDKQNKGVGTAILHNIIIAVKSRGFDGIRMLVSKSNPSALALYNKNHFKKCGETFMYDNDFYCYELIF